MSIKLTSWNVNGIRAINKKEVFHDWFNNNDSDIINLQEIRAQIADIPKEVYDVDGFNSYFRGAVKKGYSGLATYSKIQPINVVEKIGNPAIDDEGRFLRVDFEDFTLINTYFPNSGSKASRLDYKLEFCNTLADYVCNLRDDGFNIIICGDVNIAHKEIDIRYPDRNHETSGFLPEERQWLSDFLDLGFVDTFRIFNQEPDNYTWWSYRYNARAKGIGWRLDYFFVNKEFKNKVLSAEIESEVMGSDHCPITLELDL